MKNLLIVVRNIKLSRQFNATRVNGCSVKSIITGKNNVPVAIECNCSSNVYHPVINNGQLVVWDYKASIVENDPNLVEERITKKLMQLWIEED